MGETIDLGRKKPVDNLICEIGEPIIIPTPKALGLRKLTGRRYYPKAVASESWKTQFLNYGSGLSIIDRGAILRPCACIR